MNNEIGLLVQNCWVFCWIQTEKQWDQKVSGGGEDPTERRWNIIDTGWRHLPGHMEKQLHIVSSGLWNKVRITYRLAVQMTWHVERCDNFSQAWMKYRERRIEIHPWNMAPSAWLLHSMGPASVTDHILFKSSTGVDLMALISWYFKFQIIIDRSPSPKLFPLYFYYQWGRETNDCLVCQLKTTSMWSAFCHHTISEESWLNSCFSCGVDSIFRRRITVKRRCFCVSIFLPTHQGSILGGEGKAWLSWFCRSRGSACMSCWFHHQMSTADLM